MYSNSERSFGVRLQRGTELHSHISAFTGYNPPRTEEQPAEFATLLFNITNTNHNETTLESQYHMAVLLRADAFKGKGNDTSLFKLITKIRGAVLAQYGEDSSEMSVIMPIIRKMRNYTLVKPPKNPASPDAEEKISQSAQSYGSVCQFARDIISALMTFTGYNPTNVDITITGLTSRALLIKGYNDEVVRLYRELRTTRLQRLELYAELLDRAKRIKAYVRAEYGIDSDEYTLIKGLQF